ncbi:hypothetical protein [Paracoccus alkanivorans]|uniref:SLATT domain-containing protein n=1 Tax=Paracoccus alkanivorans TaxID=2116655 RepID=A0A3M0MIU2_9RHOB|nr:hypothetical protein [Paracoccus alkanivorans]RMC37519.1 hypothetical protein C9E81_01840 [Paracoccus alkanivorans]
MGERTEAEQSRLETEPGRGHQGPTTNYPTAPKVDPTFKLLFSALYHDMAETTLMRWHRLLTMLNLLLGSGAAAAIGARHPNWALWMGLAVALIGSLQLVWDFGKVARDHAVLRQRYYDLMADFQRGKSAKEVEACMTALYGAEPPIIERLRKRAHNKAGRSLYGGKFNRI